MTSQWGVYIGDNSQGNGASVISESVRFKDPTYSFTDLDKNIFIYDNDFAIWRKINSMNVDPTRTIQEAVFPIDSVDKKQIIL